MADGMERQGPEDGGEGDAAQAFEALRAEVAALRRGVELIYRGQQDAAGAAGPAAVDYSPTLGGMARTLQTVEGRLHAIEGKPAMALTPARFEGELEGAVRGAAAVAGDELRRAAQRAGAVASDLEGLVGRVRREQEQSVWVSVAGLSGFGLGALLWLLLAAVLPWGIGHRMAASLVGGGQWEAGATLMREAKPEAWDRVWRLSQACPPEILIDLCEAAMVVRTIPPGPATQPAPEGAKTLAPPTVAPGPPPSRGKVGVGR